MPITLKGPCSFYTGFGEVFSGLADRLRDRISLELLALDNRVPGGYPLPIEQVPRNNLLGLVIGHPTHVVQLPTRYRILFTMYEVSDIPAEWKLRLADADEVWVPSTFCREVFSCYRQTRHVPIGFNEKAYFPHQIDREGFWGLFLPQAVGKHVIGTAGVLSKRKGVDLLTRAFELAALPDTVLVLKTRDTRWIGPIPENAYVLDVSWPDEAMADFYRALDLFVFPTRGEGFGLPPLEAAACGTPALVTRATGPADYVDDRGVYGIEVAGLAPAEGLTAEGANWIEPSIDDLVDKLRTFCENGLRVEHRYRQWSMGALAETWEAELLAARRRADAAVTTH
jgi:glycosyltransferase involved in cell wall biosynthesis